MTPNSKYDVKDAEFVQNSNSSMASKKQPNMLEHWNKVEWGRTKGRKRHISKQYSVHVNLTSLARY